MTLQARTVLNLIAGAIGGVLAWVMIYLTGWFAAVTSGPPALIWPGSALYWLEILLGGFLGASVGLLLGLIDAMSVDSSRQRLRGLILHGIVGFLGGCVGIYLGQTAWSMLGPRNPNPDSYTPSEFTQALIAHAVGWAFIGAGVGIAQGLARRSAPLIRQGLFGGFAGGLVGGILFQSAGTVMHEPIVSGLLGFVCIGASTGFFIGLIQTLFKQAWVRVVLGRNEGKEYLIGKPVTVIGRSELADIGLFGNAKIMPHHCVIEQIQGRFRLRTVAAEDASKRNVIPSDVRVNGRAINPDVWLTDGDAIAIDDRNLLFRERLAQKRTEPAAKAFQAAAPQKLTATLKVIEGEEVGRSYGLTAEPAVIGRTHETTICLSKDTSISRKHATIQNAGSAWTVTDNGSANGTYINGARLDANANATLTAGDHIRVGDTVLRIDF